MFRPGRQASPCTCRTARRSRPAPAGRSGSSWPARATTNSTSRTSSDQCCGHGVPSQFLRASGSESPARSGLELGDVVHERGGALDLEDVDLARRLGMTASSSYGRAVQISPPSGSGRPGGRPARPPAPVWPTSASCPSTRVGPACSRLTTLGRTSARAATDGDRPRRPPAPRGRAPTSATTMPTSGAGGEHQQDQVQAEQLEHAERDRPGRARPPSASNPSGRLHASSLSPRRRVRRVRALRRTRRRAAHRPRWRETAAASRTSRRRSPRSARRSSGPAATTLPSRSSSAWVKPGGISSTWWETSTVAGDISSIGEHRQRGDQVLAAAEVEAGGRLVEQQQLGVGHQRPGDLHPLALALGQGAEGAVGQRGRRRPRAAAPSARSWSSSSYCSRQRPSTPYDADTTTSCTQLVRAGSARPGRRWSARSAAAARRRRRCRAPRRGCRPPRTWGGSAPRRPGAGWSCRRRWGRGRPSARPPRPSSRRPRSGSACPRRTVTPASSRTASMCCSGLPRASTGRAGAPNLYGTPTARVRRPAVTPGCVTSSREPRRRCRDSARFALWFSAWVAGRSQPRRHPRRDRRRRRRARRGRASRASGRCQPLILALGPLRSARADRCRLALPVPGDPLGLGRPEHLQRRGRRGR